MNNLANHVPHINPFLYWTDSYKISHIKFETKGVKEIYSNFTPRFDKYMKELIGNSYDGKVVVFGFQWMILRLNEMCKNGFFNRPKDEVMKEMKAEWGPYIGQDKYDHFEALHDLGYLPVEIKTLDEGTLVPVGTPIMTIKNTHDDFEWLPNYLESGLSCDSWKQLTVATVARNYRMISNKFAMETTGSINGTEWQNHDFSFRGQSGFESSAINGVAFLLSSCGTDNVPSLWAARNFYDSFSDPDNGKFLAGSVPAGEHSVTTSGILTEQERWNEWSNTNKIDLEEAELLYVKYLLEEKFPTGIFSYVADSFDYWSFIKEILPLVKDSIMKRDGKFVVRGDSGNPVHVIAGYRIKTIKEPDYKTTQGMMTSSLHEYHLKEAKRASDDGYEVIVIDGKYLKICEDMGGQYLVEISKEEAVGTISMLYHIFGGHKNSLGYTVLDSHIGMIYGDGITLQRSQEILTRLKEKGFASTNIVFGVGSYSLNMLSRDHLGMAIKATNTIVDINGKDVDKPIYKDPKTDTSKKSARGLIIVEKDVDNKITFRDNVSRNEEALGLLTPLFIDGYIMKFTDVFKIRELMWN